MVWAPFGPWRRLEEGQVPPPLGAYETVPHLWPFASLYRNMAAAGHGPGVVKAMLLWEAGAVLGEGFPESGEESSPMARGEVSPTMQKHIDYLLAQAAGENPEPPEPDLPDRAAQERLQASVLRAVG